MAFQPRFRHSVRNYLVRGGMNSFSNMVRFALVCTLSVAASACERSVAGACTSAQDAAMQVSRLSDELDAAHRAGVLDASRMGELGASVLAAGSTFGAAGNNQSYCTAIEKIRSQVNQVKLR